MTHDEIRAIVLHTFPGVESVKTTTPRPFVVRVAVEPPEFEDEIIEWLTVGDGREKLPVVVSVEGRCGVATSLNLEPGVTIVAGQPSTGKTTVLIGLAEELYADGRKVTFLSAEDLVQHLAGRYQPSFDLGTVMTTDDVARVLEQTERGGGLLVDAVDQIVVPSGPGMASRTRSLTDHLQALDLEAKKKGIYVVVSISARKPPRGTPNNETSIAATIQHQFPVIEVYGDR